MADIQAKPRITICVEKNSVHIYLNPEGRDLLVERLQQLNEDHEHFHMAPEGFEHAEVTLSETAYVKGQQVREYGKIYLRTDDWDRKYFPHVMKAADGKG